MATPVLKNGVPLLIGGVPALSDDPCTCCGGYDCGCCPEFATITVTGNANGTSDCGDCLPNPFEENTCGPCATSNNKTIVMDLVDCDAGGASTTATFAGPEDPICPGGPSATAEIGINCETGDYTGTGSMHCVNNADCCGGDVFLSGVGTSLCLLGGNTDQESPNGYNCECHPNPLFGCQPMTPNSSGCTTSIAMSGPA